MIIFMFYLDVLFFFVVFLVFAFNTVYSYRV